MSSKLDPYQQSVACIYGPVFAIVALIGDTKGRELRNRGILYTAC